MEGEDDEFHFEQIRTATEQIMAWKFRRRVTLFPGLRINLSRRGISTTFGIPGANINLGPSGTYLNVGVPGTGIYDRIRLDNESSSQPLTSPNQPELPEEPFFYLPQEIGAIKSKDNQTITSSGLQGVKETLLAAYEEKRKLRIEVTIGEKELHRADKRLRRFQLIPFHRVLFKSGLALRQADFDECKTSLSAAQRQYEECQVSIQVDLDPSLASYHEMLKKSFASLQTSEFVWDVTTQVDVDRYRTRSSASHSVTRTKVSINFASLDFIDSPYQALRFTNANGGDLCFYPAFLLIFHTATDFALVDYRDINVRSQLGRFIEEEKVPSDSVVVDTTWKYVNKDGSRDRRFSANYQIPVVAYGYLDFTSQQGLNESYCFSKSEAAVEFGNNLRQFISAAFGLS